MPNPRALGLLACLSCAGSTLQQRMPPEDLDDPAARAGHVAAALDGYRAAYVLLWQGARIGEARERFFAAEDAEGGFRFERIERIVVRRDGVLAPASTRIEIDCDVAMNARRLVIDRIAGPAQTRVEAIRMIDDAWNVQYGSSPVRIVDGAAVPSTLVPLLVAAGGVAPGRAFQGKVLLEGSGLAVAELTVDIPSDRASAEARLTSAAGTVAATAELDARGYVASAGSADGVASRRASEAELARAFNPPEIVDSSAVAVSGRPSGEAMRLVVSGVRARPPRLPEIESQSVTLGDGGVWMVRVDPPPPVENREVRERTAFVAHTLVDDLASFVLAPEEAMAAGRGDCTAHAIVLTKLLEERGFPTRLVTGYVLEDGALRRHRWVVVQVGGRWIPVDPMFDQVPAGPAHLALAVHGASPEELAFVDDVAFAGWTAVSARYSR